MKMDGRVVLCRNLPAEVSVMGGGTKPIMNLRVFDVSWVDMAVVLLLLVGVARGRKRGMSQELLDVTKWLVVVVVAGLGYEFCGNVLAANSVFSLLACYVFCYALLGLLVLLIFNMIRRSVGQKLTGSDTFGRGEYYMGMVGGLVRYAAIVIVTFSLLNARYYTREEQTRQAQYQQDNFGSIAFPTFSSFQDEVFGHAWSGKWAREFLSAVMIRPTAPTEKNLVRDGNIVKARERTIDQVLGK